jgi:Phasin protein
VQASLDYARSLIHAKDLSEIMRLHSEYLQAQMKALAAQASEMGQAVSRAAIDRLGRSISTVSFPGATKSRARNPFHPGFLQPDGIGALSPRSAPE